MEQIDDLVDDTPDVTIFLKTDGIQIRIPARAGQSTFREKLAEVGSLATALLDGEIVAVELLTKGSHNLDVPPAAAVQLDEWITKQHNNKVFRLVWRERLSADSESESDDDIVNRSIRSDNVFSPPRRIPTTRRLPDIDSVSLDSISLTGFTPPTTPRRNSLSVTPSKLSSYLRLTPPPVDVGENPPQLVASQHPPRESQSPIRSFGQRSNSLSSASMHDRDEQRRPAEDWMQQFNVAIRRTPGSRSRRPPSVIITETAAIADLDDPSPGVQRLQLISEEDPSDLLQLPPSQSHSSSSSSPSPDAMDVDTPREGSVNVNPFLNVPSIFRMDQHQQIQNLGVLLNDDDHELEQDRSVQQEQFAMEQLDNYKKRARASSEGIHAPNILKKVKNSETVTTPKGD